MLKKKSFTVICEAKNLLLQRFGKKLLPQLNHAYTPPPQTSNGHVNHLGGGGRNGFDTFVNVIHQQNGWRVHDVVVFKTKVLHFKIENTPIKDTNGKRKFNGMLSFLFVDKRKLFPMKLSFEEINLVSTRRIVALGLF